MEIMLSAPLARPEWQNWYRLVPAQYPPIGLFDDVCDPEDLEWVFKIEALTNDRLRHELGDLNLVPPGDRVAGPGTTPIMASFTHIHPDGSRFTDGTFGAYYAANSIGTAIAETKFHRERFLRATQQPPMEITQRTYLTQILEPLKDVRAEAFQSLHAADDYGPAQSFGRAAKIAGCWGIWFRSVRDPGGECVAILRPPALAPVSQGAHFTYVWNGESITWVYEKTGAKSLVPVE